MSLWHCPLVLSTSSLNHVVSGQGIEKICILDATEVKTTKTATDYLIWCHIRKIQLFLFSTVWREHVFFKSENLGDFLFNLLHNSMIASFFSTFNSRMTVGKEKNHYTRWTKWQPIYVEQLASTFVEFGWCKQRKRSHNLCFEYTRL